MPFVYAYNEGYASQPLTKNIKNLKEPFVLIHAFSSTEIADMIHCHSGSDFLSLRNKVITMIMMMDMTEMAMTEKGIIAKDII